MYVLIPSVLLFPILVAKLMVVVVLLKFWRKAFWWFFLAGKVLYLAGYALQALRFSLNLEGLTARNYLFAVVMLDGRGGIANTTGAFLFTCGFALCAAHLYQVRRRMEDLETITTALAKRLEARGAAVHE